MNSASIRALLTTALSSIFCLFLVLLTPAGLVFADPNLKKCDHPQYISIKRPVSKEDPKQFDYYFQLVRRAKNQSLTLVYIPGGPGHTSMYEIPHARFSALPEDMGLVLTDPRGAACNSPDFLMPHSAFSTEQTARDILSAIKFLKLDPRKVIIHGFSYGTVVATQLSALQRILGEPPFHTVILEGTLGRYVEGAEYKAGFVTEFKKYIEQRPDWVPFRWLQELLTQSKTQGLGEITEQLINGGLGHKALALDEIYFKKSDGIDTNAPTLFTESLLASEQILGSPLDRKNNENLHAQITCSELQKDGERWGLDWSPESGLILKNDPSQINTLCKGIRFSKQAYDSKKFQIREPILYLQGENDPATSLKQSLYHLAEQKLSPHKRFFIFHNFGHPVMKTLYKIAPETSSLFWTSLNKNSNLSHVFNSPDFNYREVRPSTQAMDAQAP